MMTHLDALAVAGRLLAAVGLAAVLGIERELSAQSAGLRTHALVSLGAAVFTLAGAETMGTDPTRVAAQVVSGIGFLGGGAILRERASVRGLTTAATLWAAAAIGLACGLGRYYVAALAAGAAVVVTVGLKRFERAVLPRRQGLFLAITVDRHSLDPVVAQVVGQWPQARVTGVISQPADVQRVELRARPAPDGDLTALAGAMLDIPGVLGVEVHP